MNLWKAARMVILVVNIPSVLVSPSSEGLPIDWRLAPLIAPMVAAALYVWLSLIRGNTSIDWSKSYNWDVPLFPLTKYPVQLWLVGSYSCLVAGFFGLLSHMTFSRGDVGISIFLLLIGAAAFSTIYLCIEAYSKSGH